MPTALVIDGSFFLRRFGHSFPDADNKNVADVTRGVIALTAYHMAGRIGSYSAHAAAEAFKRGMPETRELYRIFFYDCEPLTKRVHFPVSHRSLNLEKTSSAILRNDIHRSLNATRKVALRLGRLNEDFSSWRPKPDAVKKWLAEPGKFVPSDDDFEINAIQKGVDMRLGLDVASMAFKKQVDQIVLVAADADFVPAVKLARREGIDVVLDPMWGQAAPDLLQHVDGVTSCRMTAKHLENV